MFYMKYDIKTVIFTVSLDESNSIEICEYLPLLDLIHKAKYIFTKKYAQ